MTAREIARDFLSKMNPSGWNGRGYKPDTFNDKNQIKYHVDGHPEIDVDVYYEYDAGDNSWWHFCDARDNASGDKILVCVILMFGLLMRLKNLFNIYLAK